MTAAIMVSLLVFFTVASCVGLLAFVFRDNGPQTATRLDLLVGKRSRADNEKADILRKTAMEGDKRNLLDAITPKFLSPRKLFEQADCNIKPSTLMGIGLVLGVLGATASWLARVPLILAPLAGLVMFTIPYIWLLNKRRMRLKKFASQLPDALELVARALRAGHSLAAGMHVVAEEMPCRSPTSSAGSTRSRTSASPSRKP